MATVNYSVPDEVKEAFNKQFAGRNKSAVIADLMRQAVKHVRSHDQRTQAIREILAFRDGHQLPALNDDEICATREAGRS